MPTPSATPNHADLTNSGGAVPAALADVTSLSADVSVKEGRLVFADVPAGGTVTSLDTFVIEQPASLPFSPALLSWKIEAPGVPVDVTLLDSGQYDYQAGDGIYTGTFAPTGPGEYTALGTITGTSSGSAFSRQASTTFEVTGPTAGFVSFQDEVADDNGNGLADRLLIRANLDVQTAGTYRLDLNLQDSNGNLLQGGASGELAPGSRQLTVEYSAEQVLASLKTGGPWTLTNALLLYQAGGKDTAAAHAQNAATTGSRRLADFDHGPQYFTGTFSASGVDANGISGFELLGVEAGVHNEAGYCRWSATVEDQQRHGIDYATGFGDLASGDNILEFDFCGPKIYRSQKDGPYTVRAELECAGTATGDFITGPFQAAQFEGTLADFTLTPAHATAAAAAGQKVRFAVDLNPIGGFNGKVNFSLTGLPLGASHTFYWPEAVGSGRIYLEVTPGENTPVGQHSLTVTGVAGTIGKSVPLALIVASEAVAVTVEPASGPSLPKGGTREFSAAVTGLADATVTWRVYPEVGTISSTGPSTAIYTAPQTVTQAQRVGVFATSTVDITRFGGATVTFQGSLAPASVSLAPNSGSGSRQTFRAVYSDPDGESDISRTELLINSSRIHSSACSVRFDRTSNTLMLRDDNDTDWLGPSPLGTGSTLENSQCLLNPAGSTVTAAGLNLTVDYDLAFKPAFAGQKSLYTWVADGNGKSSSWGNWGGWSVLSSASPEPLTVTPSSGSGLGPQTFEFRVFDPDGYANVNWVQLVIATATNGMQSCYLHYSRAANLLRITTDSGLGGWADSQLIGSSSILQNGQCSVDLAASSVAAAGSAVALSLKVAFPGSYAGAHRVFVNTGDNNGNTSGWRQLGEWTVPGNAAPQAESVNPNSGSGYQSMFTFHYSDTNGYQNLKSLYGMIRQSVSMSQSCEFLLYRAQDRIYLMNDQGTAWLGPITLGTTETVENSQCRLSAEGARTSGAATTFDLVMPIAFKSAYQGTKNIYLWATDVGDLSTGWIVRGTWAATENFPPAATSVSPNSGSGSTRVFSASFSDPNGYVDITEARLLLSTSSTGFANSCYVKLDPLTNQLRLRSDDGVAWLGPESLGTGATLENSQCLINPAGSSGAAAVNDLTVNFDLTFKPSFAGTWNIYSAATDTGGMTNEGSHGAWTTVATQSPEPLSVSPASGSGSGPRTFQFRVFDPDGYGNISWVQLVIGSNSGLQSCYLHYSRTSNVLYISSDSGLGGWAGSVTLGSVGALQNGQCSVNSAGSSATGSGKHAHAHARHHFRSYIHRH